MNGHGQVVKLYNFVELKTKVTHIKERRLLWMADTVQWGLGSLRFLEKRILEE